MHRVRILALPTVVLFDVSIPLQVFAYPDQHDHYEVQVCASTAGAVPAGSPGVALTAPRGLDGLEEADTVVVAGFAPRDRVDDRVLEALRRAADRGARVVSICSGAFALAHAGLLDGRTATTHWHHTAELAARFPGVTVDPDVLYLDDGEVATSAGLAAGIDLCLSIVRVDRGDEAAAAIARRMVVAPHRDGSRAQVIDRPLASPGDPIAETCGWALDRLHDPLTVAALADHAGYAPRTFARRFRAATGTTPLRWLTAARVRLARRLLETGDATVADIARRTGLGTAANLRTVLARDARSTPSGYRDAHRARTR